MGTPIPAVIPASCWSSSYLLPPPLPRTKESPLHGLLLLQSLLALVQAVEHLRASPQRSCFHKADRNICINFPNRDAFIWGPGISYSSTACSEGCCFYIPANSAKVQEIEAKTVIPTWFRAKADGCGSPSGAQTTRLILNKDKNDSGSGAAICLRKEDGSFELLTGDTVGCKGKCCFFECKSCPKE